MNHIIRKIAGILMLSALALPTEATSRLKY